MEPKTGEGENQASDIVLFVERMVQTEDMEEKTGLKAWKQGTLC